MIPEFVLDNLICREMDKEVEKRTKEERKEVLERILKKVQQIQDSLTKSADVDF